MKNSYRNNRGSRSEEKPVQKKRGPKPMPKAGPLFPMRINKFLAHKGFATRRGADELIQKRWVTINGKVAVLGDKVKETDVVDVRNNKKSSDYAYFVFNKPRGMLTEKVPAPRELYPILGLDAQAEGLVLFSNDRRLVERLTNAKHTHIKEYVIKTIHPLRPNFKEKIEEGVVIGNDQPIQSKVNIRGEKLFILRTTDNGNHVRQMCSMFFAEIESLVRTKILNLELGTLMPEQNREIKDEELEVFLKALGL
jgi:23S rRNA pseudouridine2604 synthase